MPVITSQDRKSSGSNWPLYVGGCCGCLVLLVALQCGLGFIVAGPGFFKARQHAQQRAKQGTPPASSRKPYKLNRPGAATCAVTLPDGSGRIVYMHDLPRQTGGSWTGGNRAIRFETESFKGREAPLRYYCAASTRVGVYWYPSADGGGPYLRLADATGESVVDLRRGVTRILIRSKSRVYAGDRSTEGEAISFSEFAGDMTEVFINGKPAEDVSAIFGQDNGKYLGSIVRSGNTLRFEAAGGNR